MSTAYHLFFREPVHFGQEGIGQESVEQLVRSDTLWGAVLQKWFLLHDDEPETICCATPFRLTSCFPLINGTRFFPLPVGALDTVLEEIAAQGQGPDGTSVKDWRKVKFLAEPLFAEVVAGSRLSVDHINLEQVFPMKSSSSAPKEETHRFQLQEQRPRVLADPVQGGVAGSAFFYCTDQFFTDRSGLFFLAEFDTQDSRQKFEAALTLLGDSGLGADRSIGRGAFRWQASALALPKPDKAPARLVLSLYHPTRKEVDRGVLSSASSRYSLVKRSGPGGAFPVNRYRRADCWMLEEGAVLPFAPEGETPCVLNASKRIAHNIYRNGRAFCIPFQERQ